MVLKDLQIVFDDGRAVYMPGDVLTGRVRVYLDSPKRINDIFMCTDEVTSMSDETNAIKTLRTWQNTPKDEFYYNCMNSGHEIIHNIIRQSVYLEFKGEAHVQWTETVSESRTDSNGQSHSESRTEYYTANELYYNNRAYLAGGAGGETILPAGEHWYSFQFHIPLHLPSSFEGQYGHIRYTVKAVLDRPWRFNQDAKVAFTLISHVDLNSMPNVKEPMTLQKQKTLCCLCCKSGPITAMARVPLTGYVPGQDITVSADVENMTNTNISAIKCVLSQVVTFTAARPRNKTRQVSRIVAEVNLGSIGAHGSNSWNTIIKVPPCAPSLLYSCNIIRLEYKVEFIVSPKGMHTDMVVPFPITIGTIPLITQYQAWNSTGISPTAPPMDMRELPALSNDILFHLAPPSYAECVFGGGNIRGDDDTKHTLGKMEFVPCYPTYNF